MKKIAIILVSALMAGVCTANAQVAKKQIEKAPVKAEEVVFQEKKTTDAGQKPVVAKTTVKTDPKSMAEKKASLKKTVTLSANIHCKNCAKKVEENIGFEKGVEALNVSVEKRQVTITYNSMKTDVATLLAAMKKIGYPATVVAE